MDDNMKMTREEEDVKYKYKSYLMTTIRKWYVIQLLRHTFVVPLRSILTSYL